MTLPFATDQLEPFPSDPPGFVAFAVPRRTLRVYNDAPFAKVLNDCVDATNANVDLDVKVILKSYLQNVSGHAKNSTVRFSEMDVKLIQGPVQGTMIARLGADYEGYYRSTDSITGKEPPFVGYDRVGYSVVYRDMKFKIVVDLLVTYGESRGPGALCSWTRQFKRPDNIPRSLPKG